jgi:hypothetical protein
VELDRQPFDGPGGRLRLTTAAGVTTATLRVNLPM